MTLDLKRSLFYRPEEVAAIFAHPGELPWVYRHSRGRGFLVPHARRFGRQLLFNREGIDRLIADNRH